MSSLRPAILFLIFNRPDTTEIVFEKIREIKPSRLYIAADGPRKDRPEEKNLCAQARKVIEKIDWPCELKTLFREKNLGCRNAVSSGIDWFFEHEEEGIILEDDCLPDLTFFTFCESLLEKYRHDTRIMHISGNNFQFGQKRGDASYYFSKYNYIWGWASWRRAWKHYDVTMASYPEFKKSKYIYSTFKDNRIAKFWEKILDNTYDNKIPTWDHQWSYASWSQNGLAIVPNINLVSNIGFGVQASSTVNSNHIMANMPTYKLSEIIHPNLILANEDADKFMMDKIFFPPFIIRVLKKYLGLKFPIGLKSATSNR